MAKVAVAGGSIAGLSTALFAARRGHEVVLLERDDPPPEGDADRVVGEWEHPGVPQARQPHNLLALGASILRSEAPDVIADLLAAGVARGPIRVGASVEVDEGDDFALLMRRLVLEAGLHRAVQREANVSLRQSAVSGVSLVEGGTPHVAGLITDDGVVNADVCVDATGRRSRSSEWLAEHGVTLPEPQVQPCGFLYVTRYYRLRPGNEFPTLVIPIAANLGYSSVLAFPGDNDTYCLLLVAYVDDPLRSVMSTEAGFEKVLSAVPMAAEWRALGDPVSDIAIMARIENRWQRTVGPDGSPVVSGLALVGDSSMHTNPTFGRGASLAIAQAQRLADTAGEVANDPVEHARAFDQWTEHNLGVWFASQVANDQSQLDRFARALAGEPDPPITDPIARFIAGLFAVAETDVHVATALARVGNLLINPMELAADEQVTERVNAYLAANPEIRQPPTEPSRERFEELLAQV